MTSTTQITSKPMDPDIVPVALMELDHRRRIVSANTGAETLLGFSRHVLDGRSLTDLLYHDCALFDLLDRADETVGSVSAGALKLSGPNLHTGNHHVSVNRVPGGGFALAFAKSAQQDPAASAAPGLAAFGKILGHEVKNPLAGISGAAQLLKRSATEDQGELLDLVLAESRRIERLVDELSAFELFSRPERAPCNIHEVLDLVIRAEQLAVGGAVKFARVFDPSLPDIFADLDHLHEAFQNLVKNAAQAIIEGQVGDTVSVATRFALDRRLARPGANKASRSVNIVVQDNGPGIPVDAQEKVFNMFHTTKPNGSGLGLTVVSQVIAAHDGTIDVDSRPGRTRFSIHLPIASHR